MTPRNILLLHTHDTGRCISPCGYAVDTPNLARFARGSVLFRQAFDCGPTCSPARASLLTGQYPHQCGMFGLAHRGFRLFEPRRHLAHFLSERGYETILCGIQHETDGPAAALGYGEVVESAAAPAGADFCRKMMVRDLENTAAVCDRLSRNHDRPFFLSFGLFATHRPFPTEPDAEGNPDFLLPPPPVPDTPECRRDWAAFLTLVRHADRCFGQVLETLEKLELAEQTLVIVTTDHGPAFPGMKCTLTDHGCGVMLMLRVPGMRGMVSDALVSHLDLYPTICEWAGLEAPPWLEGRSLLPLLRGEAGEVRDAVFAELNFHAARDVQRTVRIRRFRYIRRFDSWPGTILPNIDDGLTKRFLRREAGLENRPRGPEEQLFDLFRDPAEGRSVAEDPAYAEVLSLLRTRLSEWMTRTDDPLLRGPLRAPEGARVNRQSGREAEEEDFEEAEA